eukprot:COSAG06_NODE_1206_length_10270_cov_8.055255_13_plen_77_part_00
MPDRHKQFYQHNSLKTNSKMLNTSKTNDASNKVLDIYVFDTFWIYFQHVETKRLRGMHATPTPPPRPAGHAQQPLT